jgi:hypothetical protein
MPGFRVLRSAAGAALALAAAPAACSNAGESLGVSVQPTGIVNVGVYLDRDGSHTFTTLDTVFAGARVALLLRGSQDTLRTMASLATGFARFDAVPVGEYTVAVAASSIGDSIQVAAIDSGNIRLSASDPNHNVLVRLGYPEVSIRAARALPQGRRVFIRGVIEAGLQAFRDTTSYVADSSGQIRLTRVSLAGGRAGNNPGDSVRALGTMSARAGQPTLDLAVMTTVASGPAPVPVDLHTATAATANGGVLDAGLVRLLSNALILDTMSVPPPDFQDFQMHVDDGTGTLTVYIDRTFLDDLNVSRTVFCPGNSLTIARGVLVPDAAGAWMLKPRAGLNGEIRLFATCP